jgi:hypothetical protein
MSSNPKYDVLIKRESLDKGKTVEDTVKGWPYGQEEKSISSPVALTRNKRANTLTSNF